MSDTRRILITGVTRGLGRILALRFAELGHQIVGCGRDRSALDALAAQLSTGGAGGHTVDQVDVSRDQEVAAWASGVLGAGGPPDLLLNNAALINRRAPLWEVPESEFSRIIDVNIKGVVSLIRAFVPAMIERGQGVVVNFSSGWGQSTAPHVAPYCATKYAIEGLTGALAQELPAGMAAVPLSPGIIHTDMLDVAFGGEAAAYPGPEEWGDTAVPFILGLGPEDNGKSLRIPAP